MQRIDLAHDLEPVGDCSLGLIVKSRSRQREQLALAADFRKRMGNTCCQNTGATLSLVGSGSWLPAVRQ